MALKKRGEGGRERLVFSIENNCNSSSLIADILFIPRHGTDYSNPFVFRFQKREWTETEVEYTLEVSGQPFRLTPPPPPSAGEGAIFRPVAHMQNRVPPPPENPMKRDTRSPPPPRFFRRSRNRIGWHCMYLCEILHRWVFLPLHAPPYAYACLHPPGYFMYFSFPRKWTGADENKNISRIDHLKAKTEYNNFSESRDRLD